MNSSSSAVSGLGHNAGTASPGNPMRLGSAEHLSAFCKMLLDTFNPYKPAVIDWPKLDKDARDRLVSLPIWDIAVQTEGRAGMNVTTYGNGIADPLLKKAIDLNAFEEKRHKHVLSNLVQADRKSTRLNSSHT